MELLVRIVQRRIATEHPELLIVSASDGAAAADLRALVRHFVAEETGPHTSGFSLDALAAEVADTVCGLGPLEPLLRLDDVTEIMVNDYDQIFVETSGRIERLPRAFRDRQQVVQVAQRVIAPLGRERTVACPFVDGRLPNRIRVSATIPPFSPVPTLTIRKHRTEEFSAQRYVEMGFAPTDVISYLVEATRSRKTIVIAGPTGSGKTTLLRFLASCVEPGERLITVEETLELYLGEVHPHVVALEARLPNKDGAQGISVDEALRHALHMRPDRLIVGEVRHKEAMSLLVAMGTGHRGSLTTVHADGPRDVIERLVFAMLQAGTLATPDQLASYAARVIDLIICLERGRSGRRQVSSVARCSVGNDGGVEIVKVWDRATPAHGPERLGHGT